MKNVFNLSFVISGLLLLTSCYSSKMLVDDDVYVVKNNALPIGESLTDETTYATYKNRKNRNKESNNYYRDNRNYLYDNNCNHLSYDPFGCGCSYYAWNMYSNYYPYGYGRPSLYYGHGFNYAFGSYAYDPFTGMYFYDPYYFNPYGYYPGSVYGGSFYAGNYGYGLGNITYGAPAIHSNQHSGPRGSISGFGNPAGRNNNNVVLKSMAPSTGSAKPNTVTALRDRPIGRPSESVRPNLNPRPSGKLPTVRETNPYRPTGERDNRTYPSNARPSRNNPSDIQQRPTQNRDINTPRQNREAAPKGSGQGGNNPRGGNKPTPSGRRN